MRFLRAWALAWLLAAIFSVVPIQEVPAQGDELLVNGDFEDGTDPWKAYPPETLTTLSGAGRGGSTAGVFTVHDGPAPMHGMRQCVPAGEGGEYEFTAHLARLSVGPPTVSVRLNTVWHELDDCQGDQANELELGWLVLEEENAGSWEKLEAAFPGAERSRSALLEVFVEGSDAVVYLDDFTFRGPPAPSPTPTPTPTLPPTLTVTPTATATATPTAVPTATPKPRASPTPYPPSTPRPARTASPPGVTPQPSSAGENTSSPAIRSRLVNGGFEETDGEGKLLAWQKYGGDLARTDAARMEGRFSAAFTSRTESTKWLFQTVGVEGGKAYDLSGYALKNDPNVEAAYFRLSWYASADGTGEAIGSADSTSRLTEDSPDFRLLTTGAVVAPAGASSAKTRLMVDPASASEATVYFDAISFAQTEMSPTSSQDSPTPTVVPDDESPPYPTVDPGGEDPPTQSATPPTPSSPAESSELATPVPSIPPTLPTRTTPSPTTGDEDRTPATGGREVSIDGESPEETAGPMPPTLYRQRSTSASGQAARQEAADRGSSNAWPVVLGLATLAVALGLGGGVYLWRRQAKRARPP